MKRKMNDLRKNDLRELELNTIDYDIKVYIELPNNSLSYVNDKLDFNIETVGYFINEKITLGEISDQLTKLYSCDVITVIADRATTGKIYKYEVYSDEWYVYAETRGYA